MGVPCNIRAMLILKMHLLFIWNSNLIGYPIIYPATLFLWPVKFRKVHPPHPSPTHGTPHFPHRLIRQDSHNYSSLGRSPSTFLTFLEQHSSYSLTGSDCQPDLWPWREVEKESSYFPKSHIQLPRPPQVPLNILPPWLKRPLRCIDHSWPCIFHPYRWTLQNPGSKANRERMISYWKGGAISSSNLTLSQFVSASLIVNAQVIESLTVNVQVSDFL